jgi:hypothetical protein
MIRWLALVVLVVGCGSDEPACEDLARVPTPETCECLGGMVRADPGGGSVTCEDDEENLGRVEFGIEGGVCCAPAER